MQMLYFFWIGIQVLIGYNLIFPFLIFLFWKLKRSTSFSKSNNSKTSDYAIIVTAYEQTHTLPAVIKSVLSQDYSNYIVYIVADKCDISNLSFENDKVVLLRPPVTLGSNTKSHQYAVDNFQRMHNRITIIDSDNILETDFLSQLNKYFDDGFSAVQGIRKAKNLDTTLSCLDAARDIYYHFYDGKLLFEIGSSATLAGSGMAFHADKYQDFLFSNQVSGAGFDKVLQAWLIKEGFRIAFSENAVVYDEKTSKSEQLVQQRSRWINTWFKYFSLGFNILYLGLRNRSRNQFIFGLVLLRPPLFIFLLLSLLFLVVNIFILDVIFISSWIIAFSLFIVSFAISLKLGKADQRIYASLVSIPRFIFLQLASLLKAGKANKISVATKHYHSEINNDDNLK